MKLWLVWVVVCASSRIARGDDEPAPVAPQISTLADTARAAASAGDCATVGTIGKQIKQADPAYFAGTFWSEALAPCLPALEQQAHSPAPAVEAPEWLGDAALGTAFAQESSTTGYYRRRVSLPAAFFESALRIPPTPLVARLGAGVGIPSDDEARTGLFWFARAALDVRHCDAARRFCLFAGLDVGYERQRFDAQNQDDVQFPHSTAGWFEGGAVGFIVMGRFWGMQASLDVFRYDHGSIRTFSNADPNSTIQDFGTGIGASIGVVRRLGCPGDAR